MNSGQVRCLIWGSTAGSVSESDDGTVTVRDSRRADGSYKVTADAIGELRSLNNQERAGLTFRLVKARQQGTEVPVVDEALVADVRAARPTRVHERAVGLLEFFAGSTDRVGKRIDLNLRKGRALAWSESTRFDEVSYLLGYLLEQKWVARVGIGWEYHVTVDGYSCLEDQRSAPVSSQAFVAMWFDPSMEVVYTNGIKPAIQDAGYEPLRIDRVEHINKIDDEIIKELRRSRFVVADFTSGDSGARGSVYYEAGFAHGLGVPVIPTCRKDQIEVIHFDTRQYAHISWSDPRELRSALNARIGAVIGEGPNAAAQ